MNSTFSQEGIPPAISIAEFPSFKLRYFPVEEYSIVWEKMKAFTLSRDRNAADELWVLQHSPVFTQGQAGKPEHILNSHNIKIQQTDRGGQVTYHAPGQLIIYLLINVKRSKIGVRQLVDSIEHSIIAVLKSYSIAAKTKSSAPGVYVDGAKIAALGLRIKQGCSYHGLSFNVDMDLTPFSYINPCGYAGLASTQLKDLLETPKESLFKEVEAKLVTELLRELQSKLQYNASLLNQDEPAPAEVK